MAVDKSQALAIHGGPKAVTFDARDVHRWPLITDDIVESVTRQLKSGLISLPDGSGIIEAFERSWAERFGVRHALLQNSGTSTIHSALFAVGVRPGDEVIVPGYTWITSVTPILAAGGTPVFCEIDPKTLCLDPEDVARRITPRTRAVIVIHLWGNVAPMDAIMKLAKEHGIAVIEDCSHAHGAMYDGRPVGSIGDVGCFSMQGSKVIYAGEAGVITTNSDACFKRIAVLGHQGRVRRLIDDPAYLGAEIGLGFKYRVHPLAVALAFPQLETLDRLNAARGDSVRRLDDGLGALPGLTTVRPVPKAVRGGFYEYRILYNQEEVGVPKARILEALVAEGVPAYTCRYPLVHQVPVMRRDAPSTHFEGVREADLRDPVSLPVTEDTYDRLIGLPPYSGDDKAPIDQYIAAFAKVLHHADEL